MLSKSVQEHGQDSICLSVSPRHHIKIEWIKQGKRQLRYKCLYFLGGSFV